MPSQNIEMTIQSLSVSSQETGWVYTPCHPDKSPLSTFYNPINLSITMLKYVLLYPIDFIYAEFN